MACFIYCHSYHHRAKRLTPSNPSLFSQQFLNNKGEMLRNLKKKKKKEEAGALLRTLYR